MSGVTGDWGVEGIAAAGMECEGWSTVGVMLIFIYIYIYIWYNVNKVS